MKLVDGRWVIGRNHQQLGERHIWFSKGQFLPESQGCDPQMAGISITEGQTVRLLRPSPEKGQMSRSCLDTPQFVATCGPGKLMTGFFPRVTGGTAFPLLAGAQHRLSLVLEWHPSSRRPSTLPSFALHETKGKSVNIKVISIGMTNTLGKILKDQKAGCGEKEIVANSKAPYHQTCSSSSRGPSQTNCLSYKLGDGSRPVVLTYVKLEVMGHLSLLSHGLPKWVPHRFTLIPVRNVFPT
ncbi:LOW QUALITY PROTEIN: hypothetical protein Cgig2_002950 [Carnegiea gigantea]|uniref:Uncharacterized protein n=1 Tax=Carnegiea gigantea TaxID=171969 RepID=A0A9Q1Q7I1_9CARY|nr:LOW QUALITY PROTEIN: hypothetical protein Cgig2_002950 [Carnegiea gigantea]